MKQIESCNGTNRVLAKMLLVDSTNSVVNFEYLRNKELDYSLESLDILDNYLETLRGRPLDDKQLSDITLRCGSYVGEVIRANSDTVYDWLEYSEVVRVAKFADEQKLTLDNAYVLRSERNEYVFPMAKVLKRLRNGIEDSVASLARVAIAGLPKSN